MKQLLLKTWLMLVCLIVGVGTTWATDVTYTVTSKSAVSTSGTAPSGSSATFANTYSTKDQLTGGNTMTLTLSGFAGQKITGITLSMHSNAKAGAGYLSVKAGSTTLASIGSSSSGVAFNNASWNGSYTSTYTNVTPTMSNSNYTIQDGENVVIVIGATTNSLFCQSFKISYEDAGAPTLSSIAVKTAPTKTTYTEGETFNPAGLVITKTLSNANTEDVAYSGNESSFTFEPSLETELSDETSVTITYGKKTTTQAITVNPFVPAAGTYTINTNNGLYGVSTGNNGTEQSVTKKGITIVSGCTSSATSKTYYDTDHIRYYADSYLKLTAPAGYEITKVVFTANGTWNSGPKCGTNGTYNNTTKTWEGSTSQLDLTFSDQNRIKSIAVTYSSVKTLQSVTVSGAPTKTTYTAGESFEPAGLTVTGHYDDESDETITEGITWSTPAALTAGQTSVGITATVGGVTSAEYTVTGLTVNAPLALSSITPTGTPAEFWKGDTFNHNGITITATWSDESTTDVTSSCTFTGYDMSTPGQQTVTVNYQGEACQYDIEVKTIANTQETAYTVAQAKALIDAGKDLATQVYVKGIVSEIVTAWSEQYSNITYAISDDGETSGTQFQLYRCVTNGAGVGDDVIAYGTLTKHNDTYEFSAGNTIVDIAKPEVESIRIEGTPSQLTYYQGDTFSTSGLSVIATYSNGNELNVIDDATISITPQTLDELGEIEVSVTVTYEGETDTQTYNVVVEEAPIVVTIDLSKDETTNASTTELIWVTTEVAVLAEKGTSTTNANNYYPGTSGKNYTSTRFYPNSVLTFIPTSGYAITSIEYVATTTGFATALVNSTWTNATASASGKTVTISPFDGSKPVIAKIGAITGGTSFVFNCEQVLPVTFKEAGLGYATVYSERALSIPEGVEAYYTTLNGNGYMEPHALTDVIPAETGVVLKYTSELTEDEVVAFSYTSKAGEDVSDNVLTGTTTDIVNPGNAYVFSVVNEEPGFYKYADGATLGANKAYYVPSASSDVQSFVLDFEGLTTSISNVSTGSNLNGSFDLQGRRVNAATRGLFIQNGKKVIK